MRRKCILCLWILLLLWAITLPASAIETSGTCGMDADAWLDDDPATEGGYLLWNFDTATGTLTISGRGIMNFHGSAQPWTDWQNQITRVVIEEGCYAIAGRAFQGCQNLSSVTLPSTVRGINEYAFYGCKALKEIQLPEALQIIDQGAFAESGIQQIEIPKNVSTIGMNAFRDCVSLKSVTFRGSPPSLVSGVFSNVTASVYYMENPDWIFVARKYSGGGLTWISVPCPGHKPEILPAKKATCTQTGLTAGMRCSLCFTTLTPQEQLPMEPHKFGPWEETVAPSQWGNGLARRCCTVCDFIQTKEIPSTTVLNPVVPPATEMPTTPPTTEVPVAPLETDTTSPTDTPEVSAGTEETTAPTQVQTEPTVSIPPETQADEIEQADSASRWWIMVLIAGVVLLGGGLTVVILFRGGITVFRKK